MANSDSIAEKAAGCWLAMPTSLRQRRKTPHDAEALGGAEEQRLGLVVGAKPHFVVDLLLPSRNARTSALKEVGFSQDIACPAFGITTRSVR